MLKRVVIVGADGRTPLDWMLQISAKYPFVEWGIRIDKLRRGQATFPQLEWLYHFYNACVGDLTIKSSVWVTGEWLSQIQQGSWSSVISAHGVMLRSFNRFVLDAEFDPVLSENFGSRLKQRTKDWEIVIPVNPMHKLCEIADATVTLFTDARANATRIESASVDGYFVDAEIALDTLASIDHKKDVWIAVEESIMDPAAKIDLVEVVKLLDEVKGLIV